MYSRWKPSKKIVFYKDNKYIAFQRLCHIEKSLSHFLYSMGYVTFSNVMYTIVKYRRMKDIFCNWTQNCVWRKVDDQSKVNEALIKKRRKKAMQAIQNDIKCNQELLEKYQEEKETQAQINKLINR